MHCDDSHDHSFHTSTEQLGVRGLLALQYAVVLLLLRVGLCRQKCIISIICSITIVQVCLLP